MWCGYFYTHLFTDEVFNVNSIIYNYSRPYHKGDYNTIDTHNKWENQQRTWKNDTVWVWVFSHEKITGAFFFTVLYNYLNLLDFWYRSVPSFTYGSDNRSDFCYLLVIYCLNCYLDFSSRAFTWVEKWDFNLSLK